MEGKLERRAFGHLGLLVETLLCEAMLISYYRAVERFIIANATHTTGRDNIAVAFSGPDVLPLPTVFFRPMRIRFGDEPPAARILNDLQWPVC